MSTEFCFHAQIWRYPGKGGWHFVTLPLETARQVRFCCERVSKGWNSYPVTAWIGTEEWRTSIFPDGASQSMVLPVKRAIRAKLGLAAGDELEVKLRVLRHSHFPLAIDPEVEN